MKKLSSVKKLILLKTVENNQIYDVKIDFHTKNSIIYFLGLNLVWMGGSKSMFTFKFRRPSPRSFNRIKHPQIQGYILGIKNFNVDIQIHKKFINLFLLIENDMQEMVLIRI